MKHIKITSISCQDAFYADRNKYIGQEGILLNQKSCVTVDDYSSIEIMFDNPSLNSGIVDTLYFYAAQFEYIEDK